MKLSLRRREERQSSGLAEPQDWLIDSLGSSRTTAGERIDVKSATQIADVFTCVNLVAETLATLPLNVYYDGPAGRVGAPNHRAARMLGTAPNPSVPAHRFWSTAAAHLLLWGNTFIQKLRDEQDLVAELWLLHPSQVRIEFNASLRQKRFVVTNYGSLSSGVVVDAFSEQTLTQDDVLHIYGVSLDSIVGMSPIAQCREALGVAKARERFEADVYSSRPFLAGTVEHPGTLKDNGVKLRESWKAVYGSGGVGRHGVAVLEEGAKFTPLTVPLEDMEFVESQKLSRTAIANIFKVPPSFIGGSVGDSLTYATVEGNQIWFARHAISPVAVNIQNFVNFDRSIFPFSAWTAEFNLEAMLRGDSGARSAFYKTMSDIGALTKNEIRALENYPPLTEELSAPPEPVPVDEQVLQGG